MAKSVPNKLGKERYFTNGQSFFADEHNLYRNFPLHWHEFYEIEYVVSGHATQVINGIEYEVGPGFAVLVTPADLHSYKNVTEEDFLTIHNAKFSPFILPPELQTILNNISGPPLRILPEDRTAFGHADDRILRKRACERALYHIQYHTNLHPSLPML